MPNRTWHFRSAPELRNDAIAAVWRWRAVSPDGTAEESRAGYPTLTACVADAQKHGFAGVLDSASGSFALGSYDIAVLESEIVAKPKSIGQ